MAETTKTAISIRKPLLEEVETAASKLQVSRSRFISDAIEEYLRQQEARDLFDSINEVYADGMTKDEKELVRDMALLHEETWDDEKW